MRSDRALAVLAGLGLVIGTVFLDQWALPLFERGSAAADAASGTVRVRIAGEALDVPTVNIRFAEQLWGGDMMRVDIVGLWPNLDAPDAGTEPASGEAAQAAIFLSVSPRDMPTDMTGRLGTIYARLFAGEAWAGPAGLVGRRLAAGSGYEGEALYFEPGATRPFVARCFAGGPEGAEGDARICLREIHLGRNLAVLYRFREPLLAQWRELDAAMRRAIETWMRA